VVKAYRAGQLAGLAEGEEAGQERRHRRLTVLSPALRRSVLAIWPKPNKWVVVSK
jgi:hypothetical protein